ncbi:hypothetical protein QFZ63_000633 [Streptomyces sp. B3I7]|nr:hypothetical protein [Streptomyces sp. B3I7]
MTVGLDLLAGRLRDFPRTQRLIREGTTALRGHTDPGAHA